ERAKRTFEKLGAAEHISLLVSQNGKGPSGSKDATRKLLSILKVEHPARTESGPLKLANTQVDPAQRQRHQVEELTEYTQRLMRLGPKVRDAFWSKADRSSVANWVGSTEFYRNYIWNEMIGKLPQPTMPPNVRTRKVL